MVAFEFVVDVDRAKMVVVVVVMVVRGVACMLLRNLESAGRRLLVAVEENVQRQLKSLFIMAKYWLRSSSECTTSGRSQRRSHNWCLISPHIKMEFTSA